MSDQKNLYIIGAFVISLVIFFILNDYLLTAIALIIIVGALVWGKKLDKRTGTLCFVPYCSILSAKVPHASWNVTTEKLFPFLKLYISAS